MTKDSKKARTVTQSSIQNVLKEDFKILKRKLGIEDDDLQVVCSPDLKNRLSGELRGKTIYIYEPNLKKAREILKHEVVDYLISNAIEPYREVTNSLIKLINELSYKRKEEIVEKITKSIWENGKNG